MASRNICSSSESVVRGAVAVERSVDMRVKILGSGRYLETVTVARKPALENLNLRHSLVMLATLAGVACAAPEKADPPVVAESARVPEQPPVAATTDSAPRRTDPWEDARARGIDFRALGQEPGWYLEIDDGTRITLVADYGERKVVTPAPAPVVEGGGARTTYDVRTDSHTLSVVVHREPADRPCRDGMSGFAIGETVIVRLDTTTYRGCGKRLK